MALVADEALGNVTWALRGKGMWGNTLLVYTSDNGGPSAVVGSWQGANNWPLRGGKFTSFEGGIRVVGFVTGGFLPESGRGNVLTGYAHGCDWYPTFAKLAGADPSDDAPGIPPVDGKDLWPFLSGHADASPRDEMLIEAGPGVLISGADGALISGDFKLIMGKQPYGFWTAPIHPNATTDHSSELPVECGETGCLFNIIADPS